MDEWHDCYVAQESDGAVLFEGTQRECLKKAAELMKRETLLVCNEQHHVLAIYDPNEME